LKNQEKSKKQRLDELDEVCRKADELEKAQNVLNQYESIQTVLLSITQVTYTSKNLDEFLKAVHQQLSTLIDTTNFYIALYDEERDLYTFPYYKDQYDDDFAPQSLENSLTDYVRRNGKALLVDNALFAQLRERREVDLIGPASPVWLGAPLKTPRGIIGVIVVQSYDDKSLYTEKELQLLNYVSEHIAAAIEWKRTEEKLQQTIDIYKTLMETSPDAVTATDLKGNIIEVTQRTLQLHGYKKPNELIGKNAFELIAPEHREKAKKNLELTLNKGFTHNKEYTLLRRDGSHFIGEISAALLKDVYGKPKGFIVTVRDISERKNAEESLKSSEEQYRLISENTSDVIVMLTYDVNPVFTYISPSQKKILGYDSEELLGKPVLELIHLEDMKKLLPLLKKYVSLKFNQQLPQKYQDYSETIECRVRDKKGNWHYFESTANIIKDGFLLISRDITERKQSEEAYRKLIEHSLQGFAIIQDNRIVFSNPIVSKLSGYTIEELTSLSQNDVKALFYPEDFDYLENNLQAHIAGKSASSRAEFRLKRKDGTIRWVEALSNPIQYQGKPAVQVAYLDITDRKRSEEALRESEDKYRSLVELANDGIVIIQDGLVKYANPRIVEMWGGNIEEAIDTPFSNYIDPSEVPKALERYKKRIANEPIGREYQTILRRKDNSKMYVEASAGLIQYHGKPADFVTIRDITERKHMEDALKESENRYRTLFDNASDAIFIHDLKGNFLEVNQIACKKLGYQREELLKLTPMDIDAPEYASLVPERMQEIRKHGHAFIETAHVRRDGTSIPIELSSRIIEYSGKPAILSIARDITERKRVEEKIKKISEEQAILLGTVPAMIFWIDKDGKFIRVNAAFAAVLRKSPDDIKGKSIFDFYPEALAQKFQKDNENVMKSGKLKRHIEELVETPDRVMWVSTDKIPYKNESGKIIGIIGISIDITERKTAEEALRESEEKFRSLAEQSPNMIFINKRSKIVYANKRCEDVMGYKREEFYSPGFDFLRIIAPESKALIRANFEKHLQDQDVEPYEYSLITKSGSNIEAIVTTKLIHYEDGKAILGIVTDITERKRMEEQIIRLNEELNEKNQQLEDANAILRELSVKDGLTKIYNHRFFQEALMLNFNRAQRSKLPLSCIMFDIDDFKKVNDIYGHRAGDFILSEIVTIVNKKVRKSDIFARYGGEEFVILLLDNDLKSSVRVAEKIRKLVETYDFVWRGTALKITISFGVSSTGNHGVRTKEAFLEQADKNLLKAKRKGKNCVFA
jgi:diguanylate cyclase (GGDEF)-like protein/PAS domain S-box-containing protein